MYVIIEFIFFSSEKWKIQINGKILLLLYLVGICGFDFKIRLFTFDCKIRLLNFDQNIIYFFVPLFYLNHKYQWNKGGKSENSWKEM